MADPCGERMSRRLLIAGLSLCCLLASAPSLAAARPRALHAVAAADVTGETPLPTVERVKPMRLRIGERLTIVGTNFIPGRRKNTVVFLRYGAPAVFLKAQR